MSHSAPLTAPGNDRLPSSDGFINFCAAIIFISIFGLIVHAFQYHGSLGEADLYRVLVGLLDGAVSGTGIAGNLHYDRDFGFGYLAAFYAFVDPATLRDPDRLMEVMNDVGFWSMMPALLWFWCAVSLIHGARAATVALIIFALGPMIPELATSGHQVIPMFALLCAAAIFMFLPVSGWRAVLAAICAAILLLASLLIRGEVFLAFPWLVLSGANTRSTRGFIVSICLRSIAPVLTLAVFFVLQQSIAATAMGSVVGHYFGQFYSWGAVGPGLVYMALGCGIFTAGAGFVAALWLIHRTIRGASGPVVSISYAELLGPIALVVVPLAFFVPNPQPTRHFMMTLAGLSILIAVALTMWPSVSRVVGLTVALGIGMVNQVLAEAVRPALLRVNDDYSPFLPVPEAYRTTTHANLGWEWQRHAALVARRDWWNAVGEMIRTSCFDHTLIITTEGEQIFSRLYAEGVPVDAHGIKIGPFFGISGVRRGKTFVVLDKLDGWPHDAIAAVLADPAYTDYRLFSDPYSPTRYDHTPIPADRMAKFGCEDSRAP